MKTDKHILLKTIKHYGVENQILKANEELSELSQKLSKLLIARNRGEALAALFEWTSEEMADVYIMLEQLTIIFKNDKKVQKYIDKKLKRTVQRIKAEEKIGGKKYGRNEY